MIDIHTHLYFPDYDGDRAETIARAFAAGVTRMVSVGTGPGDWAAALSVAAFDPRIRVALGIHPHEFVPEVGLDTESALQELEACIRVQREKIVAIGECGLDYFSRGAEPLSAFTRARQRAGFLAQGALAGKLNLPLIVHTRPSAGSMDAYEDIYAFLREMPEQTVVLHCYVGDVVVTEHLLALPQVYFSFTANVTYPTKRANEGTKDDVRRVVSLIPQERLLTETDCPFLAPQSKRGQRNEPAWVAEIIQTIAAYAGVSAGELAAETERTAAKIFGTVEL